MKSSVHAPARTPLIDAYMPHGDVEERHAITIAAPAHIVFHVASTFDIQSLPLVRTIFALRGLLVGASRGPARMTRGLIAETEALGWSCLAWQDRREYVAGAAVQPWHADVKFRPIAPERFVAFHEPACVKIAWSLEAEPVAGDVTRFQTQTRVLAGDAYARRRFLRYWQWARFGIVAIRWLMLRAVRREAERRWRQTTRAAKRFVPAGTASQGSFT